MDPAAQTNPLDPATSTDQINPGPIQPGQFVVAEQNNHQQTPSSSVPKPKQEPIASNNSPVNLTSPVPNTPDDLLQDIVRSSGGKSPDLSSPLLANEPMSPLTSVKETVSQTPPPAPDPSKVLPPIDPADLRSAQMPSLSAESTQTSTSSGGPDPTPFSPNEAMAAPPPAPEPSSGGGDKIKVFLLVIGVFALIGIIGASAWYFVLNKPKEDVKTENLFAEIIEDLAEIPKRTSGGFASLPLPSSIEASPSTGQDLTDTGSELTNIENSLNSSSLP